MRLVCSLALVFSILGWADRALAAKAEIAPSYVELRARAGMVGLQAIGITNLGGEPIRITPRASDLWYDEKGARTYPRSGTAPRGVGAWMDELPPEVLVEPRSKASFNVRIQVPEGLSPGSYFGAVLLDVESGNVADMSPARRARVAGASMRVSLSSTIVVHVPDENGQYLPPAFAIQDVEVIPATPVTPLRAKVLVGNTSVTLGRVTGSIAIFDNVGQAIGKAALNTAKVLPGQTLPLEATFSLPLSDGSYRALVAVTSLDQPEAEPLTATKLFEVKPAVVAPPPRPAAPVPAPAPAPEPAPAPTGGKKGKSKTSK